MDKDTGKVITKLAGWLLLGGGLIALAVKSSHARKATVLVREQQKMDMEFIRTEIAKLKAEILNIKGS